MNTLFSFKLWIIGIPYEPKSLLADHSLEYVFHNILCLVFNMMVALTRHLTIQINVSICCPCM